MKKSVPIRRRGTAALLAGLGLLPALAGGSRPVLAAGLPEETELVREAENGAGPSGTEETVSSDSLSAFAELAALSPAQLAVRKDLLQLRVRLGDDFFFPMTAKEASMEECRHDSLLSRAAELSRTPLTFDTLPGCPLPVYTVRSIEQLERQVISLTESYSGQWSVYVKNLTTGDTFTVNDVPMKSASVMKLFVMGTLYEAIADGELERTQEVTDLLTTMICDSSNEATNRLLAMMGDGSYAAGIEKVNDYIVSHGYSAMTHEYNGFNDPATINDPDHSNQISAADCGLLLERIYRRTFGSRQICNEVEELMLNQNTRYKIPGGLPEDALVGNKTGEMSTVENDVAIVYADRSDYILCVLSQDWDSGDTAISHIQEISALVYEFFQDPAYYGEQASDTFEELAELSAWEKILEIRQAEETESETEEEETETESELLDLETAFPLLYPDSAEASPALDETEPVTEADSDGQEELS